MALTHKFDLRQIWSHFGGPNRRERERREKERKRRRGRGGEEEGETKIKGMETNLDYGFNEIWYGSYGICIIIIFPKPRVLLGFHSEPIVMESKVGKILKSTRSI